MYRLGKKPAVFDSRTFKLANILKAPVQLPPIPDKYEFCSTNTLPFGMFGNDEWGDCVMVGRANQTLAFEDDEQGKVIPITTDDVLKEYWKEQGWRCGKKPDDGLVVLDSLKAWRKKWKAAGRRYGIYAFASVPVLNHQLVKTGIYLLNGLQFGLNLPLSAQDQEVWDVAEGPEYECEPGTWGGHLVWSLDYNDTGPRVVTWGEIKQLTWAFADIYTDEVFATVDDKNSKSSTLNVELLDSYLKAVS